MNIFILHTDIQQNVQQYVDKHVVKMPLESAQMLCTVANELCGKQVAPYKSTHINHPCTIWARQSKQNFEYLFALMVAIDIERQYRFNSAENHLSVTKLIQANILQYADMLPNSGLTDFAQCMPEPYKVAGDAVSAYRNYYNCEKRNLFKWTKRNTPDWIV